MTQDLGLEKAKDGDLLAFRELADRVLGRPATADIEQRLAALEAIAAERKEINNG